MSKNPAPKAISYDKQLSLLSGMLAVATSTATKHAILSISQSVKDARDHNLNCRKPSELRR